MVACGVGEPGGVNETTTGGKRVASLVGVGETVGGPVSSGVGDVVPRFGARESKAIPDR